MLSDWYLEFALAQDINETVGCGGSIADEYSKKGYVKTGGACITSSFVLHDITL